MCFSANNGRRQGPGMLSGVIRRHLLTTASRRLISDVRGVRLLNADVRRRATSRCKTRGCSPGWYQARQRNAFLHYEQIDPE